MTTPKPTKTEFTTQRTLLIDPGKVWVLTSTDRTGHTQSRAISGIYLEPRPQGGLRVTPVDLGEHNVREYIVYDYTKSTNNNTGKISFSSSGTKFEVRALALEDSNWLFPGQDFLTLDQLNAAVINS